MIIISKKNKFHIIRKFIFCKNNDYIKSIEYIDNEFDEVLLKQIYKKAVCYYNERELLHNPIGPARILYFKGKLHREEWWENGRYIRSHCHDEFIISPSLFLNK